MKRLAVVAALAAAFAATGACTQLDPYPAGQCGNSVVDRELLEQCDSHVLGSGQSCGAPGSAGACRYVCSAIDAEDEASGRYTCPPGFACGLDDICHRASGTFERASTDANLALGSRLGDFDGDGALDVLTSGLSRLDLSFYDADGSIASQQVIGGSLLVPPEVVELETDVAATETRHDDAVFASGGDVVVALGGDTGLTPKSYAGIRLGLEAPTFFFLVPGGYGSLVGFDRAFVLTKQDGGDGLRLLTLDDQTVVEAVAEWGIPGTPNAAVTADFDPGSPGCDEVVLAYDDHLASFRPCNANGFIPNGQLPPPVRLELEDVPGIGKRRIVSPPAIVPMAGSFYGDEVVVEVNECADTQPDACNPLEQEPSDCCHLYIGWAVPDAYPDPRDVDPEVPGFTGVFSSSPLEGGAVNTLQRQPDVLTTPATDEDGKPIQVALHPLAWGDFNGDQFGDFLDPVAVFLGAYSRGADGDDPDEDPDLYFNPQIAVLNQGFPWIGGAIADFDADGSPDVVAVPLLTPALTYLRGSTAGTMSYATVQVERPYSEIAAGDLDGDGRVDIVGRTRTSDGAREELGVLYFSDGGFAPARTIGSFPVETGGTPEISDDRSSILQLVVGTIRSSIDSIDDVAAITAYPDEELGEDRIGIALFQGRADRQLVAPITVIEASDDGGVSSVCVGRFVDGLPTIIAESSQIDLDANLEIRGSSRPIAPLQEDVVETYFPADTTPDTDTLFDAASFDGADDDDELLVAIPGCEEGKGCPQTRKCCVSGTETSRVVLLDRAGDDFSLSPRATTPLELPGLSGRIYAESFGLVNGRLRTTDLDGDGASEALIMLGSRDDDVLSTRAYLVRLGASGLEATPLPTEVPLADGTMQPTNVFGFSVTQDGQGAPLVLIATKHGLFASKVVITGEGPSATFTFEPPVPVLGATGEPLAPQQVSGVEAGDVNGDGIDDLVLTRPFATEVYLGTESFDPPPGTP